MAVDPLLHLQPARCNAQLVGSGSEGSDLEWVEPGQGAAMVDI